MSETPASYTAGLGHSWHDDDRLTPREYDVLALVAEGADRREIARRLYLGRGTVAGHLHHIFQKLRARNQAHAVALAYRRGWLAS